MDGLLGGWVGWLTGCLGWMGSNGQCFWVGGVRFSRGKWVEGLEMLAFYGTFELGKLV